MDWEIPQKDLLHADAISLGNYEIEIWEENQRVCSYMIDQWIVYWAIGKYSREIHPANCTRTEKEKSRKTNLPVIEVVTMKCSHRLDKVLSTMSCFGQVLQDEFF